VHHAPESARCDGDQAVPINRLPALVYRVSAIAKMGGKTLAAHGDGYALGDRHGMNNGYLRAS
jgi:hypothetical protein